MKHGYGLQESVARSAALDKKTFQYSRIRCATFTCLDAHTHSRCTGAGGHLEGCCAWPIGA
jgi:hypothetical protein